MNRLRAAKQLVSLYTPLTLHIGPMLEMAMIFFEVGCDATLGHDVSEKLPLRNPKNTFLGFNLTLNLQRFMNVAAKFTIRLLA